MRLTLRTMLAYLDDILEPDDTEDIGKKIEESEFATNLVHRTRDCMRRLRLGVPALFGRGLAEDPNTVAEYLDNTLGPERVGEFEKICLESDVHLAEVASCHQILTLVLGEPAEIDPRSRQRMYGLAAQVDAPPVQSDSLKAGAAVAARSPAGPPPVTRRPKPEVPEYLRESRSRRWTVAAMVLVAALLTLGGLVALGPPEVREQLLALVGASSTEEPAVEAPTQPAAETGADAPPAEPQPAAETEATTEAPPAEAPAGDEHSTAEAAPSVPEATEETKPAPVEDAAAVKPLAPAVPVDEDSTAPPAPEPSPPEPDSEAAVPVAPEPVAAKPGAADMPADESAPPEPAADAAPVEEPAELGRFVSKKGAEEVLLRRDAESGQWRRVPSMTALAKGDEVLALPLFRPVLSLSSNITLQAEGAARLQLVGWSEQQAPVLAIGYGHWTMATVGKPDNSLVLKFGDQSIQLTFVDGDATLALDVHQVLPPGADPETQPVELVVDLYATNGVIRIREGEKLLELTAPQHAALGTTTAAPAGDELPKWVTSDPVSSNRQAIEAIEPLLPNDKSVDVLLTELSDPHSSVGRRREARALAIRCLAALDNFEPCVDALSDPKEKQFWPTAMEELRSAVARSPETAAKVRTTFESKRGADAGALFRMLWGYSADDLKNGGARDLVDALDNNALDYRVMAFWNLTNITGPGNHGYRPEDRAASRVRAYNAWKEKLRQGKIVPAGSTGKPRSTAKSG